MKKFKINNKEKIISIICPSLNGIEWIILRNSEKEKEIIDKGFYEFDFDEFPKLSNYSVAKRKKNSEVLLYVNKNYPFLSRWNYGLGNHLIRKIKSSQHGLTLII